MNKNYKVIYSVTRINDWIEIAKELKLKINWIPSYWISPPILKENVIKNFPNTIFHSCYDFYRGIFPKCYDTSHITLDERDIKKYLYHQHIALKMMDRMDMGSSFTYEERIKHYYRLLNYCNSLINKLKPDCVLFAASPHIVADYILYAVCKKNNINTIIIQPTSVEGRLLINYNIEVTNQELKRKYNYLLQNNKVILGKKIEDYYNRIKGPYTKAQPKYMVNQLGNKENFILNKLRSYNKYIYYLKIIIKKISNIKEKQNNYLKIRNKSIDIGLTLLQFKKYRLKARIYKKKLENYYVKLCESPDYKKKYIYVALHYQPERTTSPEGGIYVEQEIMINLLSLLIPKGWILYVKEHPSQFNPFLKGEQGRKFFFYNNLKKISNVVLVPHTISSFNLIDNSIAVSTVTGTVDFEALLRGKPVLVFGKAWYRDCEGIYYVPNKNSLMQAIETIKAGIIVNDRKTLAFLKAFEGVSFTGSLTSTGKENSNISDYVNINNITKNLLYNIKQLKKLG